MPWSHKILIGLLALPVLVAVVAGGLFLYVKATAFPIHPDPVRVPTAIESPPARKWTSVVEGARQTVRASVAEQNLPGLSIAVGVAHEIAWAEGFGYADLERKIVVTPDMLFRIGGVSVPLTSAAVGLLVEHKKLSLDDEIQTYVPEFPRKPWPVTLRQLMANTAGVREDLGDEEPLTPRCDRTVDVLPRFARDPLRFEPGTQYRRWSYGWTLVSAAVETASFDRFFKFMRADVFEPLGMIRTVPDVSFTERIPDRVTFYFPRVAGETRYGLELARDGDYSCLAGEAGFLSTPTDLVRFGMALIDGRLLQPATVKLLQTSQRLRSGEETGYGLGWKTEILPLDGEPARMAGADTRTDFIGGSASLMTFPERGIVVAVTSNTGYADAPAIALSVAEAFARSSAIRD
jgi:CubicO group peptidase (beta-lactamase class C family)